MLRFFLFGSVESATSQSRMVRSLSEHQTAVVLAVWPLFSWTRDGHAGHDLG